MKQSGITILELMVVLAIVAILASVAVPSYQNYTMRADRSDGLENLQALLNAQERYFADNMEYADTLTKLGMATATMTTPKGHYVIGVQRCGNMKYTQCVQLYATAQGNQAKDGDLIFNSAGKQVRKVGNKEYDL